MAQPGICGRERILVPGREIVSLAVLGCGSERITPGKRVIDSVGNV